MLKVLFVDDSLLRHEKLKETLEKDNLSDYVEVTYCTSADRARVAMHEEFDLLLLDVLIPKKHQGTPQAVHSYQLLIDVADTKKNVIRPKLIVGLTANSLELGTYRDYFLESASVVLDASAGDTSWVDSVSKQIDVLLSSVKKSSKIHKDKTLITIHGIRTNGKWQAELSNEVKEYSREFTHIEVNYHFFDLVSFSIPFLRKRKINIVSKRVINAIENNKGKEIYIIAHSFGTLILLNALRNNECLLKRVILCGSPLKSSYEIEHISRYAELVINECGTRDYVLVAARCFLLGLGDAGRVGFSKNNDDKFINRYHSGYHSSYFEKDNQGVSFANRYWLPIITSDFYPNHVDSRKNYLGEDALDLIIKLLDVMKPIFYYFILFAIIFKIITFF
ncbi:hypothetical protein [Pectobacterium versatile]|uniref:Uncharacterized protein n=1 Tax=Pectobacterium versatile TaxID=2488639 RepID=A0A855MHQ2_9GAMM|nr:hypothetical protein [Pectobacterium versatile]POY48918.1 hypothetical protein F131LOC_03367 [Pectobacterium versatile]